MSGPYSVTLADLIDMADAAAELDGLQFAFVDQPDEQARLRMRARKLHDMVERAAGEDYARVGAACNDRVEGRDAASSRRVPSHDGLCGNGNYNERTEK